MFSSLQPHNSIVNVFIVVAVALCAVSIYFILQIFFFVSPSRFSIGFWWFCFLLLYEHAFGKSIEDSAADEDDDDDVFDVS